MALRASRQEYNAFDLDTFRQHIYQEVRRQKFIYFLNVKRAEKQKKQQRPTDVLKSPNLQVHKNKNKRTSTNANKDGSRPHKRNTKVPFMDMT